MSLDDINNYIARPEFYEVALSKVNYKRSEYTGSHLNEEVCKYNNLVNNIYKITELNNIPAISINNLLQQCLQKALTNYSDSNKAITEATPVFCAYLLLLIHNCNKFRQLNPECLLESLQLTYKVAKNFYKARKGDKHQKDQDSVLPIEGTFLFLATLAIQLINFEFAKLCVDCCFDKTFKSIKSFCLEYLESYALNNFDNAVELFSQHISSLPSSIFDHINKHSFFNSDKLEFNIVLLCSLQHCDKFKVISHVFSNLSLCLSDDILSDTNIPLRELHRKIRKLKDSKKYEIITKYKDTLSTVSIKIFQNFLSSDELTTNAELFAQLLLDSMLWFNFRDNTANTLLYHTYHYYLTEQLTDEEIDQTDIKKVVNKTKSKTEKVKKARPITKDKLCITLSKLSNILYCLQPPLHKDLCELLDFIPSTNKNYCCVLMLLVTVLKHNPDIRNSFITKYQPLFNKLLSIEQQKLSCKQMYYKLDEKANIDLEEKFQNSLKKTGLIITLVDFSYLISKLNVDLKKCITHKDTSVYYSTYLWLFDASVHCVGYQTVEPLLDCSTELVNHINQQASQYTNTSDKSIIAFYESAINVIINAFIGYVSCPVNCEFGKIVKFLASLPYTADNVVNIATVFITMYKHNFEFLPNDQFLLCKNTWCQVFDWAQKCFNAAAKFNHGDVILRLQDLMIVICDIISDQDIVTIISQFIRVYSTTRHSSYIKLASLVLDRDITDNNVSVVLLNMLDHSLKKLASCISLAETNPDDCKAWICFCTGLIKLVPSNDERITNILETLVSCSVNSLLLEPSLVKVYLNLYTAVITKLSDNLLESHTELIKQFLRSFLYFCCWKCTDQASVSRRRARRALTCLYENTPLMENCLDYVLELLCAGVNITSSLNVKRGFLEALDLLINHSHIRLPQHIRAYCENILSILRPAVYNLDKKSTHSSVLGSSTTRRSRATIRSKFRN